MIRWQHVLGTAATFALVASVFAAPDNFVQNPGFEDGVPEPWTSYGEATLDISDRAGAFEGSNALEITVQAAGANFWDSGIKYEPDAAFEHGTLYTWAVFLKADKMLTVNMKPELSIDPWTAYGEAQKELTEEWVEHWVELEPDVDVQPAALTMHVGFDDGTIWMDSVRFYEGAYEPTTATPYAVDPSGKLATQWSALRRGNL
ncbi:hypothetical protein HN766_21105 [Candidatus Poribacteria bacterium]|jgi:hypothetical protein|nr:hypothetical protein [Candidatus Poribacteria bacterium]